MQLLYDILLREEMAAFALYKPGYNPQFDAMLEGFDVPMTYWVSRAKARYIQSMETLGFPPFWDMEKVA